MSRCGWQIAETGAGVRLSRPGRACMDVSAETLFPDAAPLRLAHQVRQDLWRAMRRLRGFSPVVEVTRDSVGYRVIAGGAVAGVIPPDTVARIAMVLENPANRARWLRHARPAS